MADDEVAANWREDWLAEELAAEAELSGPPPESSDRVLAGVLAAVGVTAPLITASVAEASAPVATSAAAVGGGLWVKGLVLTALVATGVGLSVDSVGPEPEVAPIPQVSVSAKVPTDLAKDLPEDLPRDLSKDLPKDELSRPEGSTVPEPLIAHATVPYIVATVSKPAVAPADSLTPSEPVAALIKVPFAPPPPAARAKPRKPTRKRARPDRVAVVRPAPVVRQETQPTRAVSVTPAPTPEPVEPPSAPPEAKRPEVAPVVAAMEVAAAEPSRPTVTPDDPPMRGATPSRRRVAPDPEADAALLSERALLARAHAALRSGEAGHGLSILAEYPRRFARGRLGEEHLMLRVRALVMDRRMDEARRVARRFAKLYPKSILGGSVRRLVAQK